MAKTQIKLRKASENHVVSAMCQCFGLPSSKISSVVEAQDAIDAVDGVFPWLARAVTLFPWEVDITTSIYKGDIKCQGVQELLAYTGDVFFVRDGVRPGKDGLWVCFAAEASDMEEVEHVLRGSYCLVISNCVRIQNDIVRLYAISASTIARWQNHD